MLNSDYDHILNAIFLGGFLLFLIALYLKRKKDPDSLKNILMWTMIFSILVTLYAFRFDLDSFKQRILLAIFPLYSWTNDQGQLMTARNQDGHFYLNCLVNNNSIIRFLVDTGATDIVLTKEDAEKIGFDTSNLYYTERYNTANGDTYAAPLKIKQLKLGDKTFYNLDAHITSGKLSVSLLGMSLIGNFSDFKITKDMLILSY